MDGTGSTTSVDSERKKKKGFQKLKAGFKFSGALKRRRRKKNASNTTNTNNTNASLEDDASYDSYSIDKSHTQEWIGNSGEPNSAGGRGRTLTKIAELPEEDDGSRSGEHTSPKHNNRRGSVSKRRPKSSGDSVSSNHSKRSIGSYFGKKERAQPDPLSLVVLLVESSSLRFELVSLDFDLTPKRSRRTRKADSQLKIAVQDVLDQITPEALTDESLQAKASTPGACLGLIDRTGKVHFGGASLEDACANRPLRAFDEALLKQKNSQTNKVLLSVPTYGGEPHKDVLLGFFGTVHPDDDLDEGVVGPETKEAVEKALELARPIFADPSVIGLMESSGYDLKGWKTNTQAKSETKLGKPLPPPVREKSKTKSSLVQLLLGVLVVFVATILAWSLVAGGLHYLPSLEVGDAASPQDGPMTLEGHVFEAYAYAKDWYHSLGSHTEDL